MLALLFLMGVGPMLPWRRATLASVRHSLFLPGAAAAGVVVLLLGLGVRQHYALMGFGLSTLVAAGILLEWFRGTRARRRSSGENYLMAFFRLIAANRPRYGGYMVHLAVVMVALGVIGTTFFNIQRDAVLAPGDTFTIQGYQLQYLGTAEKPYSDRTEFVSTVAVYRDGQLMATLRPQRAFYPSFNMASTRAAIRSTPVEDLFIAPSENREDGSVGFRIMVNPLIWWMWVAGPVLVLGTLVALWPEGSRVALRAPSPAMMPAGLRTLASAPTPLSIPMEGGRPGQG
jgi:cytochrome c-type biogenesis protein CcmF